MNRPTKRGGKEMEEDTQCKIQRQEWLTGYGPTHDTGKKLLLKYTKIPFYGFSWEQ
jgi:hypothetical protein